MAEVLKMIQKDNNERSQAFKGNRADPKMEDQDFCFDPDTEDELGSDFE